MHLEKIINYMFLSKEEAFQCLRAGLGTKILLRNQDAIIAFQQNLSPSQFIFLLLTSKYISAELAWCAEFAKTYPRGLEQHF
jgi:hypothetical protein